MAINLDNYISSNTPRKSAINLDNYLSDAQKQAAQKALNTPVVPKVQEPEPEKTVLQKASKIAGDFAMGLVSPIIKGAELTWQGLKTTGQVYKAGAQLALGDKKAATETVTKEGLRLQAERSQPMKVFGREVERTTTPKQAAGLALEVASYGIGYGEALAAKNILKTSLTQGFAMGAKKIAERTAYGALAGGMFSAGAAMEENKTPKQIALETAKGLAIGSIFELGMIGIGAGASAARKSITNIMKGAKPHNKLERLAAQEGEKLISSKVKVGEPVVNANDPNVSYEKSINLGHNEKGEPILSRTEINTKTGQAKIFINKSLDNNPGQKALILERETQRIIDSRLEKPSVDNITVLDKNLKDLGLRLGKTDEEIKVDLNKDLRKLGGWEAGQAKFAADPAAVKSEAPTFATLIEHQTDPNITIHTTSAADVIANIERRVEETKAKIGVEYPKSETYTPTASKRIEAELQAKKLVKEIDDLPEVERVHIKDQAMEYGAISKDKNLVERILKGETEAPGKLKASSVWRFESEKAAQSGDVARQIELARSPLAKQFSEEGANIAMLRGMNRYNPVNVIRKINELKSKKFVNSGKVARETERLKTTIRKASPKKEDWASFIDSIRCS